VFLRLLAESLSRGSRRKLLAATAVALGILAATALAEVLLAAGDRLAAELGAYGANLEIVPAAGAETFPAADLALLRKIFWRNNVVALAPTLPLRVRLFGAGAAGGGEVAPVVGTWFAFDLGDGFRTGLPAVRPTLAVAGRWPADGAAEAAVGRRLAARLGVGQGDALSFAVGEVSGELLVVGLVTSGGEEEEQAFAPLAAVHAAAGRRGDSGGPVPRAEVFALTTPEPPGLGDPAAMTPEEYDRWYCTAYPSAVAHQIDEVLPGARARVVPEVAAATAELAGRLRPILLALAALTLLGAAVGATAAMTATVVERRLEAALASALGAEGWKLVAFFTAEAALLGLAGGLVGGGLGLPAGRLLGEAVFAVAVPWAPVLLPVAAAAGVALALAGFLPAALLPLRRAPAALLKGATG
jgi:putative ABC transport system permease protein